MWAGDRSAAAPVSNNAAGDRQPPVPVYGFNALLTEEDRNLLSPESDAQPRLGEGADFHRRSAHPNGPAERKANGKAISDMALDLNPNP